ncbi:hypothetical protein KGY79_05155 [Candidatus Bipolaricaulota bacterium]|nr:hypothetical protein [Candidatus Bipolaricaulota bacterium]
MPKGKVVYLRKQGKKGQGEELQIFPGVKAKELKKEVDTVDLDSVPALERGGSEVVLDDDSEVYHQVNEGENIYASDRGVFGLN